MGTQSQSLAPNSVSPVYTLAKNVPDDTNVYDICFAAEKGTGPATIDGATCLSGLWRIYPFNEVTRAKLLTSGICLKGKIINLEGINPYIHRGAERSGTRLTISGLPFSYSSDSVARNLSAAGIKLRSSIQMERARAPDHTLSDWKTGRRFVWIDLPSNPIPRSLKMGEFQSQLYHREMRQSVTKCYRCLQEGHRARECPNDEVCHTCKLPGHRRGDPMCGLGLDQESESEVSDASVSQSEAEVSETDSETDDRADETEGGDPGSESDEDGHADHGKEESTKEEDEARPENEQPSPQGKSQTEIENADSKDGNHVGNKQVESNKNIDNDEAGNTHDEILNSVRFSRSRDDTDKGKKKVTKKAKDGKAKKDKKTPKKGEKPGELETGKKAGHDINITDTPDHSKTMKQQQLTSFIGKRGIEQTYSPNNIETESPEHQRLKLDAGKV